MAEEAVRGLFYRVDSAGHRAEIYAPLSVQQPCFAAGLQHLSAHLQRPARVRAAAGETGRNQAHCAALPVAGGRNCAFPGWRPGGDAIVSTAGSCGTAKGRMESSDANQD